MLEIEAKFLTHDIGHFDRVLRSLMQRGYTILGGDSEVIVDRYLDTPEMTLFRAGWTYRCREREAGCTVSLKAIEPKTGSLFIREEIEQELAGGHPALRDLPDGAVVTALRPLLGDRKCRELFRVESERTTYAVIKNEPQPTHLNLALDQARLIASQGEDAKAPLDFDEFELELVEGDEDELQRVAELLGAHQDLVSAQLSKFERGLHASGLGPSGKEGRAAIGSLGPKSPLVRLVFSYLRVQLDAIRRQRPRAWEGLDPEGVHQMRVAIRKTRSVLRTFRDLLDEAATSQLTRELRWLARCLGNVRDTDVFQRSLSLLSSSAHDCPVSFLKGLEEQERTARNAARAELLDALSSSRFDRLETALQDFVEAGPTPASLHPRKGARIIDGAKSHVRPSIRKLLKRGRRIRKKSPSKDLHRLRIESKRLRYLLDVMSSVDDQRWDKLLRATRRLQDVLGDHHDAVAAGARIQIYADSLLPAYDSQDTRLAVRCLLQADAEWIAQSRRRFRKEWKRFEKSAARAK